MPSTRPASPSPDARPPTAARAAAASPSPAITRALMHPLAKPLLFLLALAPFGWYAWRAITDQLGANPQEALERGLGDWTLRLLCLTLAVTPLRKLTGWHVLVRFRRMLGLFSAFYMAMHFVAYAGFDKGFVWHDIVKDIGKRPFILVGTLAGLCMLPLAATSFNRAIKAMGGRRWQLLHRLVYVIAGLGLLHFFWMKAGKHDFAQVAVYAAILAFLLGYRVWDRFRPRQRVRTWSVPQGGEGLIGKSR